MNNEKTTIDKDKLNKFIKNFKEKYCVRKFIISFGIAVILVIGINLCSKFEKFHARTPRKDNAVAKKLPKINLNGTDGDGKVNLSSNDSSSNSSSESKPQDDKKQESKKEADSGFKDGTHTRKAKGYNGDITVSVDVKGGKITSINIASTNDDAEYLNKAKSVIQDIISSQSTDVDTISGATYSSGGIIDAVNNAIEN